MVKKIEKTSEIIGGRQAVLSCLKLHGNRVGSLIIARGLKGKWIDELIATARKYQVKVRFYPRSYLDRMLPHINHQGVIIEKHPYEFYPFDQLLPSLQLQGGLVLAIDGIYDPRNLGAVIRSAAAFDCSGILLPKDRTPSLTPAVAKVASGTIDLVHISRVTNLSMALRELKEIGFYIIGTSSREAFSLWEENLSIDIVIVVGAEDKGLRPGIKKICDKLISIPMNGQIESLNLSVATGIILAEAYRQRNLGFPTPSA